MCLLSKNVCKQPNPNVCDRFCFAFFFASCLFYSKHIWKASWLSSLSSPWSLNEFSQTLNAFKLHSGIRRDFIFITICTIQLAYWLWAVAVATLDDEVVVCLFVVVVIVVVVVLVAAILYVRSLLLPFQLPSYAAEPRFFFFFTSLCSILINANSLQGHIGR